MDLKKQIPNLFTSLNLFSGCIALFCIFLGFYFHAAIFLCISLAADFLDGFTARKLNAYSPFGKEIDSLADMVSFGVVPGTIFFKLIVETLNISSTYHFTDYLPALPGFIFTVFAAWRLAKFNIDTRQSEEFRGLSTPPATVFTLGLLLIHYYELEPFKVLVETPIFIYICIIILSILLVMDFRMFALKSRKLQWKGNEILFIFIVLCILMFFIFREAAFSINVILYIAMSFLNNVLDKK
jgi:CDP-diacylglycerol--serine O-phosphatidyltransferase